MKNHFSFSMTTPARRQIYSCAFTSESFSPQLILKVRVGKCCYAHEILCQLDMSRKSENDLQIACRLLYHEVPVVVDDLCRPVMHADL